MKRSCLLAALLLAALSATYAYSDDEPVKEAVEKLTEAEREDLRKRAKGLDEKTAAHYRAKRYEEALQVSRQSLALRERADGPEHLDVAQNLLDLATILTRTKSLGEAQALQERGLAIQERVHGPNHLTVVMSRVVLGHVLRAQGDLAGAMAAYEQALASGEKTLGPEHPTVARLIGNLLVALHAQGDHKPLRPLLERQIAIYEKAHGPDHPKVAKTVDTLAAVLSNAGALAEALPFLERAAAIRERTLAPDDPARVTSFQHLVGSLQKLGAHERVPPVWKRVLAGQEQIHGRDHAAVAATLHKLALALLETAAHAEARAVCNRALAIYEKTQGPEGSDVAEVLNLLGVVLYRMGIYEEARPAYERALRILTKANGADHVRVTPGLANLALVLKAQGSYDEARPLLERALSIREKAYGPNHPRVATSLAYLGGLLLAQKAFDEARPMLERALAIREKALGADHPDVSESLNNLGVLLLEQGELEEALSLLRRALAISERRYGPDHPEVAVRITNMAGLLHHQRAYGEAERLFQRALAIEERTYGPDHHALVETLIGLAVVAWDQRRDEPAGAFFQRALSIIERRLRRSFVGLDASQRLAMTRSLRWHLDTWVGMGLELGRGGLAEVLRFKGLVARAVAAERRMSRRGGPTIAQRVKELHGAEQRFSELANSMPSAFPRKGREERRRQWREAYAAAGARSKALSLALARDFEPLREGLARLDLKLSHVIAQLGDGEVLVDILRTGQGYVAWVLRADGTGARLELGAAKAVDEAAANFAELTADEATDTQGEAWRRATGSLHSLVWEPIRQKLGTKVSKVYLSPDAALAAVPFAALPGRVPGRFLLDDVLIVQIAMAQDLVPWPGVLRGEGALLVGDVSYGAAAEAAGERIERQPPSLATRRAPRGGKFARLEGTGAEVAFIRAKLGKASVVLEGPSASEARLRAHATGKRILHFATHGFVRSDVMRGLERRGDRRWLGVAAERQLAAGHDPMTLAGLAMAGANVRAGGYGDDGILTALEASHLDLDGTELVVLSACKTALGRAESGEGVIGLVQAFQMAGAQRVIASLWQVDDEATRMLMEKLYEGMLREKKPLSPAAALRAAAQHVRSAKGAGGRSFAHPHYWAAFTAYGR